MMIEHRRKSRSKEMPDGTWLVPSPRLHLKENSQIKTLKKLMSWWLNQPIWKICASKWDHFPKFRGENKKYLKPPTILRPQNHEQKWGLKPSKKNGAWVHLNILSVPGILLPAWEFFAHAPSPPWNRQDIPSLPRAWGRDHPFHSAHWAHHGDELQDWPSSKQRPGSVLVGW